MKKHKFKYDWKLSDGYPSKGIKKHDSKVFSCYACGGGSTMGYKLAGYDVIGMNEIDPKMAACYIENHKPKYSFIEPIQEFKDRQYLPKELFDLDILDGSPPCSSFSMAGNREKDWGKKKKFREGQAEQILDRLFFDFLDLAERLQPKVIIAENVKGILMGKAKQYSRNIVNRYNEIGYKVKVFTLDASRMGVPQKRERVFFIGIRKDLAELLPQNPSTLFNDFPLLDLVFFEDLIPYSEIEETKAEIGEYKLMPSVKKYWDLVGTGRSFSTVHPKGNMFNFHKTDPSKPLGTLLSNEKARDGFFHHSIKRSLTKKERLLAQSFPLDYNTLEKMACYMVGMSVPPVMLAQIADRIYNQWIIELEKIQRK